MPLDPSCKAVLEQAAAANMPALSAMSPTDSRAMYREMNKDATKAALAQVTDMDANGVAVRVYRPKEQCANNAALVYYHGGGWVIGDLETHDAPCRALAVGTGALVIAVDYRLAPEHAYPIPLNDCYTATRWVFEQASTLGINAANIAVGGDSAGANLAAVIVLKARQDDLMPIKHQLLIYPVTDSRMNTRSYTENAEGYLLTKDTMAWFWDHYANRTQRLEADASPLNAQDLTGLPATTLVTAEFDPLRDEGAAYARRLQSSGNDVFYQQFDGLIHGFISMTDVVPAAAQAFDIISNKLKQALCH